MIFDSRCTFLISNCGICIKTLENKMRWNSPDEGGMFHETFIIQPHFVLYSFNTNTAVIFDWIS